MNTYHITASTHTHPDGQKQAAVVLNIPHAMNGVPMSEIPESESKFLMTFLGCFKQLEVEFRNQGFQFQMELNEKIVIDHSPKNALDQN